MRYSDTVVQIKQRGQRTESRPTACSDGCGGGSRTSSTWPVLPSWPVSHVKESRCGPGLVSQRHDRFVIFFVAPHCMGTVRAGRASADVDVVVSSLAYPGLGDVGGVCSRPDGTLLATNSFDHTVLELDERGGAKRIAGRRGRKGLQDGPGDIACFDYPTGILAARDGNIIVVGKQLRVRSCARRRL